MGKLGLHEKCFTYNMTRKDRGNKVITKNK